jgi:hypothetical protein
MFQSNPDDPESDYEVEEAELQPHKSKRESATASP